MAEEVFKRVTTEMFYFPQLHFTYLNNFELYFHCYFEILYILFTYALHACIFVLHHRKKYDII